MPVYPWYMYVDPWYIDIQVKPVKLLGDLK